MQSISVTNFLKCVPNINHISEKEKLRESFNLSRGDRHKILPVHGVVAYFVMAKPTSEQLITTYGPKLAVTLVMLASIYLFLGISKRGGTSKRNITIQCSFRFFRQLLLSRYPSTDKSTNNQFSK